MRDTQHGEQNWTQGRAHGLNTDGNTMGKEHTGSHRHRGTERGNAGDHISWAPLLRAMVLSTGFCSIRKTKGISKSTHPPCKPESSNQCNYRSPHHKQKEN